MKAAILVSQNAELIVDEVELPGTLEVGQVLVKVHFSGICGSQLGEIDGAKGEDTYLPHLLGHEASGTVLEIGPGVIHVRPGDLVVLHWRKSLGIESVPPVYRWHGKTLNAGWVTTFNEYAIVAENRVTTIPVDSNLEVAALFGCAVTTGFGVIQNNARVRIGESIIVFGAGGVGLNIVQAASLVGAYPIIAVDVFDNRLALAKEFGATHTINSADMDFKLAIKTVMGGQELDVFVDNTGQPEIIELGYHLTGGRGRVVLVGVPRKNRTINLYSLPLHFGKILSGSHGGESIPNEDIPRYHRLYRAGRIKLNELITERYKLEDINHAITRMRKGLTSGRCLIDLGHQHVP